MHLFFVLIYIQLLISNMKEHIPKFKNQIPEFPTDLFDKVIDNIETKRKLRDFKKRIIFSFFGIFSSSLISIPLFKAVWTYLGESGFLRFFSLIFSDFKLVLSSWQNFGLSLLESIPIISLTLFLISIFILFESIKYLIKYSKSFNTFNQLIKS